MSIVIVTGSGGLIGAETVKFFSDKFDTIIGIDNDFRQYFFGKSASVKQNINILKKEINNYKHQYFDIRNKKKIERIFKKYRKNIKFILHNAAQPSHDWAAKEPFTDFSINALGTLNILECMRKYSPNAKLAHMSTNKVYGDRPNLLPLKEQKKRYEINKKHKYFLKGIDETMSIDDSKHSLFGASKLAADIYCQEYWKYFDLKVGLKKNGSETEFEALLSKVNGKSIVSSNDFDSDTGILKNNNSLILSKQEAEKLISDLEKSKWVISSINEKPRTSNPKPPFTTSTLQQEAARKLRFSAKNTMRVAQQLYENGFITYMRTDSTHLSEEAIKGSRNIVSNLFGDDFLPNAANKYETKVKNAQEAHEAIRPAHREFLSVEEVKSKIGKEASKLYELIWQRTIASQMLPAKLKQTSIIISNQEMEFKASGQIIIFPGYMKIYVEGKDNPDAELANKEKILPELSVNEELLCSNLTAHAHKTNPPSRFTEASLVKEMETNGIGRPSTFASALDTIVKRGYVQKTKSNLSPTYLGLAVTQLLENHFSTLVDKKFTAKMENGLDAISRGELEALPFMKDFYFGSKDFSGLATMLDEKVDIGKACTIPIPSELESEIDARIGRYGPYLRKDSDSRSIPENIFIGDLTADIIDSLFKEQREDEPLGKDPETDEDILLKKGPYGYYVQLGETTKRKTIPKGTAIDQVGLDLAISLLSLPRVIGTHPDTNLPITADYGRYGPYLKMDKSNARLIGDITPLNVTVKQALEILSKSKKGSSEIRNLGKHPDTGEDLVLKEGRYGPYVSDGKVNAALKSENNST